MNELITKVQAHAILKQEIYDSFSKDLILEYLRRKYIGGFTKVLAKDIFIKGWTSDEVEICCLDYIDDSYYIPFLLFIDKETCLNQLEKELERKRMEGKLIKDMVKQKRERLYEELKKEFGNV
jgi:hypothetical protein